MQLVVITSRGYSLYKDDGDAMKCYHWVVGMSRCEARLSKDPCRLGKPPPHVITAENFGH